MNSAPDIKRLDQRPMKDAILSKNKFRILGKDTDELIKIFFASNAWIAIVILALITFSLFREGLGFFPQHQDNLTVYRKAGLEYVDYVRDQYTAFGALLRFSQKIQETGRQTLGEDQQAALATLTKALDDSVIPLDELLSEMTTAAADIKEKWTLSQDAESERKTFLDADMKAEAEAILVENVNFAEEVKNVTAFYPRHMEISAAFAENLKGIASRVPKTGNAKVDADLGKLSATIEKYVAGFPMVDDKLKAWDPNKPYGWSESVSRFILGSKWVTQSFWQDWYGFVPLFMGSLAISFVALLVAVPFGVGAAIYINQLASPQEQNFIKPYIEFISAIPSVVLGFFGIAVLGETIRWLTQGAPLTESVLATWPSWTHGLLGIFHSVLAPLVKWVPFFPISERLNITTAGLLLGLMAVPTIFTLAEDAINNVPRAFKEASFALGANRMQTITRIIVPAALSGIISAVLLGFGRVIGETMVVLMCAGNRIEIPDFTQGLGFIFEPVHTMTGLIAQEIPEVVKGSLQYRALFMLAIMLFLISLLINYLAQLIVKKYRISIG